MKALRKDLHVTSTTMNLQAGDRIYAVEKLKGNGGFSGKLFARDS
jgi:hypothetical protein